MKYDPKLFSLMTFPMKPDITLGKMTIKDTLDVAKAGGLLSVDANDITEEEVDAYLEAERETGIQVYCYNSDTSMFDPEDILRKNLAQNMKSAKAVGASLFMIIPYAYDRDLDYLRTADEQTVLDQYVKGYSIAVEMAKDYDLKVCFEPTPQDATKFSATKNCKYVLDHVPGLGFVFDTANMMPHGEDTLTSFEIMKPYIIHVHLKDVVYRDLYTEGGYQEFTPDGKRLDMCLYHHGVIPIDEVYQRLMDMGYNGKIAVEYVHPVPDMFLKVFQGTYQGTGADEHKAQIIRFFE